MLGSTTTILMLLVIVVIYMLPTLIAFGREHPRRQDIADGEHLLLGMDARVGWHRLVFLVGVPRPMSRTRSA